VSNLLVASSSSVWWKILKAEAYKLHSMLIPKHIKGRNTLERKSVGTVNQLKRKNKTQTENIIFDQS